MPMDFSQTLIALQEGKTARRSPWNYYVYLATDIVESRGYGLDQEVITQFEPTFVMRNDQGHHLGWTPSAEDMLADDWELS